MEKVVPVAPAITPWPSSRALKRHSPRRAANSREGRCEPPLSSPWRPSRKSDLLQSQQQTGGGARCSKNHRHRASPQIVGLSLLCLRQQLGVEVCLRGRKSGTTSLSGLSTAGGYCSPAGQPISAGVLSSAGCGAPMSGRLDAMKRSVSSACRTDPTIVRIGTDLAGDVLVPTSEEREAAALARVAVLEAELAKRDRRRR
jgi:hypothetical protein